MSMLIDHCPEMAVLAEAGSADEAIDAIEGVGRSQVVVVIGTSLGGGHDAFWLIREIRRRFPTLSILGCGARADAMSISRALFVGADGFVDKGLDPRDFLQSIREAASGELVLSGPSGAIVGAIADGIDRRRDIESMLTEREREVLTVAAEGLTARQIGERLGVRERTITTHLARIYGKLGVGSRVGALRVAATSGMVSVVGVD
jgi:two-component system, NarL family, response regulator DevR